MQEKRTINRNIVIILAACITTFSLLAALQSYKYARNALLIRQESHVFGFNTSGAYMTIRTIDLEGKKMLVDLYSPALDASIPFTIIMTDELEIIRQDPVFEDGVVIGYEVREDIPITELAAGVRAFGVMNLAPTGELKTSYILIGDPFPRP